MISPERGIVKTEALFAVTAAAIIGVGEVATQQADAAPVASPDKSSIVQGGQANNLPAIELGRTITVCAAPNSHFFEQRPGVEPGDDRSLARGTSKQLTVKGQKIEIGNKNHPEWGYGVVVNNIGKPYRYRIVFEKYSGGGDTPINLKRGKCGPGNPNPLVDPDTDRAIRPDRPDDDDGSSRLVEGDDNSDGAITYRNLITWDASCDPNTGNSAPVVSSDITFAEKAPVVDVKFGHYGDGFNRDLFSADPNVMATPHALGDLAPTLDQYGQTLVDRPAIAMIRQGGRLAVTVTLRKKNGALVRVNLQRQYEELCSTEAGSGDIPEAPAGDSEEFLRSNWFIKPY